jgi:oxygen-independent coproporphyrinogen-3 oxidase
VAHRRIGDYVAGVHAGSPWSEADRLSPRDAAEERLLLGLRTVEGVPAGTLGALGLSTTAEPVASLISDGFLALTAGRLAATAQGRPVLDGVLKALLT